MTKFEIEKTSLKLDKNKSALKLDKNKTGLIGGLFLAITHLIWSLLVLIIPSLLQKVLDWIFEIHALNPIWTLTSFNFMNLIWLLIVTFVIGYISGWIMAVIVNYIHRR